MLSTHQVVAATLALNLRSVTAVLAVSAALPTTNSSKNSKEKEKEKEERKATRKRMQRSKKNQSKDNARTKTTAAAAAAAATATATATARVVVAVVVAVARIGTCSRRLREAASVGNTPPAMECAANVIQNAVEWRDAQASIYIYVIYTLHTHKHTSKQTLFQQC